MTNEYGTGRYATSVSGVTYRFEDLKEAKAFCRKSAQGNRCEVSLMDGDDLALGPIAVYDERGDQAL